MSGPTPDPELDPTLSRATDAPPPRPSEGGGAKPSGGPAGPVSVAAAVPVPAAAHAPDHEAAPGSEAESDDSDEPEDLVAPAPEVLDRAACPRCRHGLQGDLLGWRDACPLHGRCSECGLAFTWSEVLCLDRAQPTWSIEHGAHPLGLLARLIRSSAGPWRPWAFFRRLPLRHQPRLGRLVVGLVVWLAVLWVLIAGGVARSYEALGVRTAPSIRYAVQLWSFERPTIADAQPNTLRPQAMLGAPPMQVYPNGFPGAPIEHAGERFGVVLGVALALSLSHAIAVLTFAVLPVARRRAKVAWVHLWRVLLYGWLALAGMAACILVVDHVGVLRPLAGIVGTVGLALVEGIGVDENILGWVLGLGALALYIGSVVVFWSFAAGRYLRMESPWAVGASVAAMGVAALPFAMGGVIALGEMVFVAVN